MDERQTRQALDAIADLLLTGPVEHAISPPPAPAAAAGNLPSGGPAPRTPEIHLAPPPTPGPARLRLRRDPDFDLEPEAPAAAPSAPAIQVVLLGNLPGFATPWVSQYAQHATTAGPVALLRVDGANLELEVFSDPAGSWRCPVPPGPGGPVAALGPVVQALGPHVALWLVVLSTHGEPGSEPPLRQFKSWTLLTGADEPAVVAAYRILKSQIELAGGSPEVGLMFMGCDEPAARLAVDRIAKAAAAYLQTPMQFRGVKPRMGPVHRVYLGRFQVAGEQPIWPQVEPMLGSALTGPAEPDAFDPALEPVTISPEELAALTADGDPAALDPEPAQHEIDPPRIDPLDPFTAGLSAGAPRVQPPAEPPPPDPMQTLLASTLRSAGPEPAPPPAAEPRREFTGLCRYVSDAGIAPLAARCPRQPLIELAADAAGRVHLLRQADGAAVPQAISEMQQAAAWALEHADLLALTAPGRKIDARAGVVLQLFTDQPRLAADLAFAGPAGKRPLRLHLLKSLRAGEPPVHEELT